MQTNTRIILILTIILVLVANKAKSQDLFPIIVTPTLTPPYSLKLSDYSAVGSQNLMVSVIVNDLNIADLPVKLRIKMETAGVTIENPPTVITTPIYLNGGVNTILFGQDLEDYFKLNNLIFKGYSKEAYRKTGQLPGGYYNFSVELLHYNSNRVISNTGKTGAWIVLGKPPVLKSPIDNAEEGKYTGMPITFSWLESNVGSPGAKGSIQYHFEMWEMRIPGINPNTVVMSTPVFHEHTTFNTLYSLYPSTLLMEPGMQYAWRVTASDVSGIVPFEQDGKSEVRTFIYKAKCNDISNLQGKVLGKDGIFTWDADQSHTSFNIEIQQPETGWFINGELYDAKASYYDLEPGQTYQMRVQGVCNGDPQQVSDFSEWKRITVPVPKPKVNKEECPTCECDDDIKDLELENFELKEVQPGDTIINKNHTTRFIVRSVQDQGDKTYKGIFLFWAEIWGVKIVCNYENLQVNTDNEIVNMQYESVYDPKFLIDVDVITDIVNDLKDNISQVVADTKIKDSVQLETNFDQIIVRNDSVIAVTVDEKGEVKEEFIDKKDNLDNTLIKDKDGEKVVISGKGQPMGVKEFKETGGNKRLLDNHNKKKEEELPNTGEMVSFTPSLNQKYGFDTYTEQKQVIQEYYPALNNGYRAAFKSLPTFGTDKVKVSTDEGISFRDEMGIKAISDGEDLLLRGSFEGAEVPLYAYSTQSDDSEQVVGKLQMLSYTPQSKKLYIIKVNNAPMPNEIELQTTLNNVYAQALTTWQVQKLPDLQNISFANEKFTHGGSSAFTTYNNDQKTILEAFEQSGKSFEEDAMYLFFVGDVQKKESNIQGYMPLKRQAGFIYDNPNLNIIAHELGHGAFNLHHTFSDHRKIANEGQTQNLMDYKGGTELWRHQWDLIHDPENILFAWGQKEEEGAYIKQIKIQKTIKANSVIDFGLLKVLIKSAPVKTKNLTKGKCEYKINNVSFDIGFNDNKIGNYDTNLKNAELTYIVDCKTDVLQSAKITWKNTNKTQIKDIGFIDALVEEVSLNIDNAGKVSGNAKFKVVSNEDKFIASFIKFKKGATGAFSYTFTASADSLKGDFDVSKIQKINLDFIKNNEVIASVANGKFTPKGVLIADIQTKKGFTYTESGIDVSLVKLKTNLSYQLGKNSIKINSISGNFKLKNIPGLSKPVDVVLEKKTNNVIGVIKNIEKLKYYGLEFSAKQITAKFNNSLELTEFGGTNITASYENEQKKKSLKGNLDIASFKIKDGSIKEFKGQGSVSYPPYAEIKLTKGLYDKKIKALTFNADVALDLKKNNSVKAKINKIKFFEDGKFEIGEVAIDAMFEMGPVTVEFEKKPANKKEITKANAKVKFKVKEGDVDEEISFSGTVEYKKDKKQGITYLKVNTSDLNLEFPSVYGIESTVKSITYQYQIDKEGKKTYSGNVVLDATLKEDKFIYKNMVKLNKGLEGTIKYSFNSKDNNLGGFDLSNLQKLKLQLIKDKKSVATFTGSVSKKGIASGLFKVDQPQDYANSGFKLKLKKFDVNAKYDLKKKDFKFVSGSGKVIVYDVSGLEGDIEVDLKYKDNNFVAGISAKKEGLKFCKMEVSGLNAEISIDDELNISKISGGFSIQPTGMDNKLSVKQFTIENGELKSLTSSGNVNYKNFKFDIKKASYANKKFSLNAKVLLGDSYVEVSKFDISETGEISIGKVKGDFNKSLMAIKFEATFSDDRFQGSFDATISKKLKINGIVDMGSSQCKACEQKTFNFGYFGLTVGAAIPIFPGVSISKLGGRFGYNYEIDFDKTERYGSPVYGSYLAGLSFGLQDNAGIVELAVDPAIYQWGNSSAELYLKGTIKAPKNKPVLSGSAEVSLKMPSYDISGSVNAQVKVPPASGFILDASTSMEFEMNQSVKRFAVNELNASVLKVLKFNGSFSNSRNYNENGDLTSASGHLNGSLKYDFKSKFKAEGTGYSIETDFAFNFNAYLNSNFTDQGLQEASFGGSIYANAAIEAKVLGCTFNPYCTVNGNADVTYEQLQWSLNAAYKVVLGLKKVGEIEKEGSYTKIFNE